jgi:hypothetical protein
VVGAVKSVGALVALAAGGVGRDPDLQ